MDKLIWRHLPANDKNKVIEIYFDSEDPDDIHYDIVETLQKGTDFTITLSSIAEWFDKQDVEYQLELIKSAAV